VRGLLDDHQVGSAECKQAGTGCPGHFGVEGNLGVYLERRG